MTLEEHQRVTAADLKAREAENAARSIRGALLLVEMFPNEPHRWLPVVRSTLKGTAFIPD